MQHETGQDEEERLHCREKSDQRPWQLALLTIARREPAATEAVDQELSIGPEAAARQPEGVQAREVREVRRHLRLSGHVRTPDQDGDDPNASLQRGRHFDAQQVLIVIKPLAPWSSVTVTQRSPITARKISMCRSLRSIALT
jgi:hypothetical protein